MFWRNPERQNFALSSGIKVEVIAILNLKEAILNSIKGSIKSGRKTVINGCIKYLKLSAQAATKLSTMCAPLGGTKYWIHAKIFDNFFALKSFKTSRTSRKTGFDKKMSLTRPACVVLRKSDNSR